MPRKHLFPLVVLLAAAAVAGVFALSRTVELGQAAKATETPDTAIAYRLDELDRFKASLRKQLAETPDAAAQPQTVYRRAAAPSAPAAGAEDEHEHEDSGHEYEHEDAAEREDEGRDD
jgi:hypothetical protein